ncbi:hypothetical protein Daesc_000253 [Daldinia eschscholtzii]|uniref:Uncharacterized protein n=1 Tax=Daldinia eschscholtzii TaxID=292717 RepID=A0AAX6MYI8_9PEZI
MVYGWQLWLSPRPLKRTDTPLESRMLSPNDAALYEFLYDDDGRFVVKETHYAENKAVRDGLSGPPLEDLVFKVWAEPQELDHSFDEKYLRNALGYLRDCQQQNMTPSVFQMALLGWSSDTIFVTPSFWVPIWILKSVQYVVGRFIGELLLG